MNLLQRVQDILLRPKATWPEIAAEPADAASLYKNYLLILALIPAVAGFIGFSLVGFGGFGATMRIPIASGLVSAVVGYVLSLVMVFVLALIVDALAPSCGGAKDFVASLKLTAYAYTVAWLAGIFNLLGILGGVFTLIATIYAIYTFFLGAPVLNKSSADKAVPFTIVVVLCGIVLGVLAGYVFSGMMMTPRMHAGMMGM